MRLDDPQAVAGVSMRKHGKQDSITRRFSLLDGEERDDSRRHTQLSFESGRQAYRWLSESRRNAPNKH